MRTSKVSKVLEELKAKYPELYTGGDIDGHYRKCKKHNTPCYCFYVYTDKPGNRGGYRADLWPTRFDLSSEGLKYLSIELSEVLSGIFIRPKLYMNPSFVALTNLPVEYVDKVHSLVRYAVENYRVPLE